MGSRGSSSGMSGGGGAIRSFQDGGTTIDLSETPLRYGTNAAMATETLRNAIDQYERKRANAGVEFCQGFDADGNPVSAERRGGKGSCRPTINQVNAEVHTHNHPREEGVLGGSFSEEDINNFMNYGMKTMRASAKEGTYSITKGKSFDASGARAYFKQERAAINARSKARSNALNAAYRNNEMTWSQYDAAWNANVNRYMVDVHNMYIAGAKKYGYGYTLERRS